MKGLLVTVGTSLLLWTNLSFADCNLNGKVTWLYANETPGSSAIGAIINGTFCFGTVTSGVDASSAAAILGEAMTSNKDAYLLVVTANNIIQAGLE